MPPFILPANLAAFADAPRHRPWLAELPEVIAELADRWELTLGEAYQPGGQCSWVAPAVDRAGRELAFKAGMIHPEAEHEAAGLRQWDGNGAVRLFAEHRTVLTHALLLERCAPGTPLKNLVAEPDQDHIIADLLRRLWSAPTAGPFRPLADLCAWWADEAEEESVPGTDLDPGLFRAGLELFRELPTTADRAVLLATDLHAENVLAATREPWLVIDPKPYVGDPAYDVLQHMLNCRERLEQDPGALAGRMAQLLDLDPVRVRQWAFARSVQESPNQDWLRPVARALAP